MPHCISYNTILIHIISFHIVSHLSCLFCFMFILSKGYIFQGTLYASFDSSLISLIWLCSIKDILHSHPLISWLSSLLIWLPYTVVTSRSIYSVPFCYDHILHLVIHSFSPLIWLCCIKDILHTHPLISWLLNFRHFSIKYSQLIVRYFCHFVIQKLRLVLSRYFFQSFIPSVLWFGYLYQGYLAHSSID